MRQKNETGMSEQLRLEQGNVKQERESETDDIMKRNRSGGRKG